MIILPKAPKLIDKKDNWGKFEIESLYPGYGITIGNNLRRVLLSSLPGAAITQVKIKGVQHEFSTMKGVMEDVMNIIMNLKQMRFKVFAEEPQKATLNIKGEKEAKGSDFDFPSQVELVNKDCHIASLTDKKSELEMEIQIEKGLGYEPVERRKMPGKLEIGVMPIDAIFAPIKRVSYKVENMRVGERTDFDRLFIEIETDGTITPEDAFAESADILLSHFSLLAKEFKKEEQPKKNSKEEGEKASEKEKNEKSEEGNGDEGDASKTKVEDMKFSARTMNALVANNIKTAGGIFRKSEENLSELEGLGEKGIEEIKKALKKLGLELKQ